MLYDLFKCCCGQRVTSSGKSILLYHSGGVLHSVSYLCTTGSKYCYFVSLYHTCVQQAVNIVIKECNVDVTSSIQRSFLLAIWT